MTTLLSDNFTGTDGDALSGSWTSVGTTAFTILSNAASATSGTAPFIAVANPSRANDNYNISVTLPGYPGASRPEEGIILRRTGTIGGGNLCGYLVGCDDSSNAYIWKITNGVLTSLTGPTYKGSWLAGTLTASVSGSSIILASSVDGTTVTATDSTYASGDAGIYAGGTGVSFDNFVFDGTSAGSTGTLAAPESGSDTFTSTGNIGNNGIRLTLRDTDTGALATSLTGLIVSIRSSSNAGSTLVSVTNETTDGSGILEIASGAIGNVGDYVYVTVEKSDHTIVATYRVQVIDLNA